MIDILEQEGIKIVNHLNDIPRYIKNDDSKVKKINDIDSFIEEQFRILLPTKSQRFATDVGMAWIIWRNRRNLSCTFVDLQSFLIQRKIPISLNVMIDAVDKESCVRFDYNTSINDEMIQNLKSFEFHLNHHQYDDSLKLLNGYHSIVVERINLNQQLLKDLESFQGKTDCILYTIHDKIPLMVFVDSMNQESLVSRVGFLTVNIESKAAMDLIYVD